MWRPKKFCLNCKKSLKGSGTCGCSNQELVQISYKTRIPKQTSSKSKWKKFFKNEFNIDRHRAELYSQRMMENECRITKI